MPQRDHEDLDDHDLPTMVPDEDELALRQSSHYEAERSAKKKAAVTDKPATPWGMILVILVLMLGMGGLAGWNYVLQQHIYEQHDVLVQSQARIGELESKLSNTDESMSKSGVVMQVQLKELQGKTEKLWDQMDKLWASAWRRNQKELTGHTKQLKALQQAMDKQSDETAVLQTRVSEVKTSLESQNKKLSAYSDMTKRLKKAEKQLTSLDARSQKVTDKINKLGNEQSKLSKRVQTNEEWVQSINAFRKQVNANLDKLQKSFNRMQSAAPTNVK